MVKQSKSQRLRDKIRADIKHSKQTTLGSLPEPKKAESPKPVIQRQIEIADVYTSTREDELTLKVGFKLFPSRTHFSRVTADLFFDDQKVDSLKLRIVHGPLSTDELEFSAVLDMTGVPEGKHKIRVEICELWDATEKLLSVSKAVDVNYVPVKREDRLIRIPIIKKTAGADLDVISETERNIYREIDAEIRKDSEGRRDYW